MGDKTFIGKVKFFDHERGYGFIIGSELEFDEDIFFHANNVLDFHLIDIDPDDTVEFKIGKTRANNREQALEVNFSR